MIDERIISNNRARGAVQVSGLQACQRDQTAIEEEWKIIIINIIINLYNLLTFIR